MKIRLLGEWMSNPIGAELNILDSKAKELISRGCAIEYIENNNKEPIFDKKVEADAENSIEDKAFDGPEKNKMFTRKFVK